MKQPEPFTIRTYGESELAMIYFPKLSPKTAVQKLRGWVVANPRLRKIIRPEDHDLKPKQVRAIIEECGLPEEKVLE